MDSAKKIYTKPSMEVIRFETEDVITTSDIHRRRPGERPNNRRPGDRV